MPLEIIDETINVEATDASAGGDELPSNQNLKETPTTTDAASESQREQQQSTRSGGRTSSVWHRISTSLPVYSGHNASMLLRSSMWRSTSDINGSSSIVPRQSDSPTEDGEPAKKGGDMKRAMLWLVRFAIIADAINGYCLGPNHAIMVLPDGAPDSFPSTEPVGYATAYTLLSTALELGSVFSSLGFGYLSDKVGRKKCLLACMYMGAVGSALKYLARNSFWGYIGATLFNGLFAGSPAVGSAYISDLFTDQATVDIELGNLVAIAMVARAGGGIIAVSMQSYGLFVPLWVSAAISVLAGVLCHVFLQDMQQQGDNRPSSATTDVENPAAIATAAARKLEHGGNGPQELDKKALINVLAGELADNLGSLGLVPFAISPLMFNAFYQNFVSEGLDPIMTATAYKWLYMAVAVSVVPGSVVAPMLYQKVGPAISAVMANLLTGAATVALLHIANASPTVTTFALFIVVYYTSFPLTVISQLSTGPMLDRITPESQRGQIQGCNVAIMNLSASIGQVPLGALADATSIDVCLYTTAAISVGAALINSLLIKDKRFGPTKEEEIQEVQTAEPSRRLSIPARASMLLARGTTHARASLLLGQGTSSRLILPRLSA